MTNIRPTDRQTDKPTNKPTKQQTDMWVHREVTLISNNMVLAELFGLRLPHELDDLPVNLWFLVTSCV